MINGYMCDIILYYLVCGMFILIMNLKILNDLDIEFILVMYDIQVRDVIFVCISNIIINIVIVNLYLLFCEIQYVIVQNFFVNLVIVDILNVFLEIDLFKDEFDEEQQ